ncbi:MAG: dienelactone hydrolase family protein [Candidatus Limnocylindria bacterium]
MCFDADARPPLPPMRGSALDARDLTLSSADGTQFAAYAARAEDPSAPGVVILPDVRGLHHYFEELALRFAEAGVHAVALDPYARSAGPAKRDEGFEFERHLPQLRIESLTADIAAAADCLRGDEGGPAERIYTVGFCLGGRISLLQAARAQGIAGVIGFYPWPVGPHRSLLPAPADEASDFRCPVLTLYGGADAMIPAEVQETFDAALDAARIEHRTVVYEGAPHSFFDRKATEFGDASADAWREVLEFIGVPPRG